MSLRTRRAQGAAAGSAMELPRAPLADIRTRKWTKQLKTVGHITILKWVPDQENPTEALQKGVVKKTKGRKRPAVEVGRMTRSVRQHLDAPLELLSEYPSLRHSTRSTSTASAAPTAPAPTLSVAAAAVAMEITSASSSSAVTITATSTTTASISVSTELVPPSAPTSSSAMPMPTLESMTSMTSEDALMDLAGESLFSDAVASEEQLERALDDLPFLDTDNLAMDPALALGQPNSARPTNATGQQAGQSHGSSSKPSAHSSSSAVSSAEDEEDDDNASAISMSPVPSPSPATSPMMSRSPTP